MSIQEDLRRRLKHYGLDKAYVASLVCDEAKKISQGEFEPVSYKDGVLKVKVSSAGRGQIVKMREKLILEELNSRLTDRKVARMIVVVGE